MVSGAADWGMSGAPVSGFTPNFPRTVFGPDVRGRRFEGVVSLGYGPRLHCRGSLVLLDKF